MYTVLSEWLPEHQLWPVMWLWQQQFAQRAQFELNEFFSQCSHYPAIKQHRSQLYRRLIGLLMAEDEQLKDDPWPTMQRYQRQQQDTLAQGADDYSQPLNDMMSTLLSHLRSDTIARIQDYIVAQGARTGLPAALIQSLVHCIEQQQPMALQSYDEQQLRALLNLFYIGLCESLGPVKADQLLSEAIQRGGPLAQALAVAR
ncbi:hypothetical protein CHH28_01155 [Bacterioplanes sanyensis]|uniref:Uncharacterized protein n=2 Tax=Bacterioplanes sanyensis TaxID=1249553 RepID=A0A222FGJ7_9GAMM|nr:hypothetical protein CHH28_01155 [Bacterioplanes sanyensis]